MANESLKPSEIKDKYPRLWSTLETTSKVYGLCLSDVGRRNLCNRFSLTDDELNDILDCFQEAQKGGKRG